MDERRRRSHLTRFMTPSAAKAACAALVVAIALPWGSTTASAQLLQLEAKIPLGEVAGRIDHMAIDLARRRLFVAELGNDTVGVVDLATRKVVQTIAGLKEPQGVGYVPATDTLYVANARDGAVRMFQGADYAPAGQIDLGDDADNIRVDAAASRLVVGYGRGGLAVIDTATRNKIADIRLKAHPEGFQLDPGSRLAFVNVPDAHEIAVVDRDAARQIASWPIQAAGNFPMALDPDARQVLTVFRSPARLGLHAMADGKLLKSPPICGDSDDVFLDAQRHRLYVSCGAGFIDVLDTQGGAYAPLAHIATSAGARTALFVPELDRLLLAVRARPGEAAAIWVFRPQP
jgi:YVTN family beta-propeller protein